MSTTPLLDPIAKLLNDRLHELERKRTRHLALQQWDKVIEVEARRDEVLLWRKRITDNAEKEANQITTAILQQQI